MSSISQQGGHGSGQGTADERVVRKKAGDCCDKRVRIRNRYSRCTVSRSRRCSAAVTGLCTRKRTGRETGANICESVRNQEKEDIEEPGEEAAEAQAQAMAFVQCRSSQVREGQARHGEMQQEAEEVEGFWQMIESWVGCHVACRLGGQENVYHAAEHCPEYESEVWENIRGRIAMMSVDDDGGRFERVRGGHC